MAEGQRPHEARGAVVRLVIAGIVVVRSQIVDVLRRGEVAVLVLERAGGVVLRDRQRQRAQKRDVRAHAPLVLHLERVVARLAAVEDVADVAPRRDRPTRRERNRPGRVVRRRLVVIRDFEQVGRLVANIRDVDQHVRSKLTLQ